MPSDAIDTDDPVLHSSLPYGIFEIWGHKMRTIKDLVKLIFGSIKACLRQFLVFERAITCLKRCLKMGGLSFFG